MLIDSLMRALSLDGRTLSAGDVQGRVLTHDLASDLRKGSFLTARDVVRLRPHPEVHVMELEPGDVHEDEAGRQLAEALATTGAGRPQGPRQSQYRLLAPHRGLLKVDVVHLARLNALPGIAVFTLFDGQAVEAGEEVAGCKVTPVAVPADVLDQAVKLINRRRPVRVLPFHPLRTLIVVTERLKPKARDIFTGAVARKLGWYGAEVIGVAEVARNSAAVAAAYREAAQREVQLVLFAGASAIDPLDAAYAELERAGGGLLRFGMPAHPGSMLWVGRLGPAVVLGIASCAGFGRSTSLDLVLPFVFARADLDLASLGHGGLIEAAAGRRFPPYPGAGG
jgi:hypothetical protein